MLISKLSIHNIRNFEQLDIEFGKKIPSILIAGDNGDGKSTLLRCIAMGICDESSAAALLRELDGDFVRKGHKQGTITIELINRTKKYKIVTIIKSLKAFEKVEQKLSVYFMGKRKDINQDRFPWDDIFVCGYGAGVRVLGTEDYKDYVPVDAVYPLFKYDWPLQNPELTIRRMIDKARKRGGERSLRGGQRYANKMRVYILKLLKKVLNLQNKDEVILGDYGIEIKSYWGKSELGTLGDGYRATTTWVMDLFSWWMLHLDLLPRKRNIYSNKDISGIVILDEIEQHLHPKWQLRILNLLKETFKNIQFIITTHSPLVLSGSDEIPIHSIEHGKHIVKNASGWLAEDVYRDIMGLPTTRSGEVKDVIDEYKYLHFKKLNSKVSNKELSKLRSLKLELRNKLPNTDPIVEVDELKNISKFLGKANAKRNKTIQAQLLNKKRQKMDRRIIK